MINLKTCFRCGLPKRIWKNVEGKKYCQSCYYVLFPKKALKGREGLKAINKAEKKESVSSLTKKLDTIFSRYIRLKYQGEDGLIECYTCGSRKPMEQMQCGHFHSRSHKSVRWSEDNTRPQDYACNIAKKGNYIEYYPKLERELGKEKFEALKIQKDNPAKYGKYELKAMILEYIEKVKHLENKS